MARNDIVTVADEELGEVRMANAFPFLSATPGRVRHAGPRMGQHNREIFVEELALSEDELESLRNEGII